MFSRSVLVTFLTVVISVTARATPRAQQQIKSGSTANSTAAAAAGNGGGDAQTSLTLDPKVIASGFANNGQDVPTAGQVASLTSTNNFINFCLTVPNLPITNGQQITTGSCNPAPMGIIPSQDNMPSSKFTNPPNFGTIQSGVTFNVEMAIQGMQTGFFVNAKSNYFSAPQQLNAQGQIQGHSHVTIEKLTSLEQTTPLNSKNYIFFKGLNDAAVGGQLSAAVTGGLAAGFYRLASINTAANHQPALVPIAQHGSLDDFVYFTVTDDGKPLAAASASSVAATSASSVAAVSASSVAATASATGTATAAKGAATAKGAASAVSSSVATATAAPAAKGAATRRIASRASSSKATATATSAAKGAATSKAAAPVASSSKAVTGKAAAPSSKSDAKNAGKAASPKSVATSPAAAKNGKQRRAFNRL